MPFYLNPLPFAHLYPTFPSPSYTLLYIRIYTKRLARSPSRVFKPLSIYINIIIKSAIYYFTNFCTRLFGFIVQFFAHFHIATKTHCLIIIITTNFYNISINNQLTITHSSIYICLFTTFTNSFNLV